MDLRKTAYARGRLLTNRSPFVQSELLGVVGANLHCLQSNCLPSDLARIRQEGARVGNLEKFEFVMVGLFVQ
jgi:hypothetical protein